MLVGIGFMRRCYLANNGEFQGPRVLQSQWSIDHYLHSGVFGFGGDGNYIRSMSKDSMVGDMMCEIRYCRLVWIASKEAGIIGWSEI